MDRIQLGPNKPSQRGDGTDVQGQRRSRREASRRAGGGEGGGGGGKQGVSGSWGWGSGVWLRSVSDAQGVSGWLEGHGRGDR